MLKIDWSYRNEYTLVAFYSESKGIGSMLLEREDKDFYLFLEKAIDDYNRSKQEEPPQTITGGNDSRSGESSIKSKG